MKDKISMALQDPVLQQGFEIICKENAELDCQMNRNKYCYSCVNATDKCFRNEIGCPFEKYKSYKDENAELEKENAKLQEKISVLLSCKNCPENKGGWICAKEYENKCLTQKIEFIKELEEEKCELLGIIQGKDKVIQKT